MLTTGSPWSRCVALYSYRPVTICAARNTTNIAISTSVNARSRNHSTATSLTRGPRLRRAPVHSTEASLRRRTCALRASGDATQSPPIDGPHLFPVRQNSDDRAGAGMRPAPVRLAIDIACPARRWQAPQGFETARDRRARRRPPCQGRSRWHGQPRASLTAGDSQAPPGSLRRRPGLRETVRTTTRTGCPEGFLGRPREDREPSEWPCLRQPGDRADRSPRRSACRLPGSLGETWSAGVRRTRPSDQLRPRAEDGAGITSGRGILNSRHGHHSYSHRPLRRFAQSVCAPAHCGASSPYQ